MKAMWEKNRSMNWPLFTRTKATSSIYTHNLEKLLWKHTLRDYTVRSIPPTERLGKTYSTTQTIKFGHHTGSADNTNIFRVTWQDEIRIIGRAGHVLADVLQKHLNFDVPCICNIH